MGSSPSTLQHKIENQEAFVKKNFADAKKYFSSQNVGFKNACRYSDYQIKMKLRQEYYKHSHNNEYITDYDWKKYKKSLANNRK